MRFLPLLIQSLAFSVGTGLLMGSAILAVDGIVVRPSSWQAALRTWKEHRARQGLDILELDAELGQAEILGRISKLYREHAPNLRFLLLAGDVDPQSLAGIPTFYRESSALVRFGGDKSIATDNPYADVDGDEIPELAVGRIPADSAEQLEKYLARVIAYESDADFSDWRRRVHVVAGVGGFGAVADSLIEMTTRRFLAERIPGWSVLSMTQASTQSHYCPDPWRFSEACLHQMNQGGMLWVYIGHGHIKTLDYVRAGQEFLPILTNEHLPAVASEHPPIAVFLACYTGAFDASQDSLAEQLVLLERGPIAAIAATRVSGPYGLSMLSDGLLDDFYQHQKPTLGEVVLSAKQRLLQEPGLASPESSEQQQESRPLDQSQMIEAIASALSPAGYDLRAERLEHVWQMHLLGDPMMRVHHPSSIQWRSPDRASPGESLLISGEASQAGQLTLELAFRRDQLRRDLAGAEVDLTTADGREQLQQRYLAANNRVLVCTQTACPAGPFECSLAIPEDLPNGKYCLRLFLQNNGNWQVGYREISIRRQPRPTEDAQ